MLSRTVGRDTGTFLIRRQLRAARDGIGPRQRIRAAAQMSGEGGTDERAATRRRQVRTTAPGLIGPRRSGGGRGRGRCAPDMTPTPHPRCCKAVDGPPSTPARELAFNTSDPPKAMICARPSRGFEPSSAEGSRELMLERCTQMNIFQHPHHAHYLLSRDASRPRAAPLPETPPCGKLVERIPGFVAHRCRT